MLVIPSTNANIIEVNKNLILKNSLPSSIASNTIRIELLPDQYPEEIRFKDAQLCITSIKQPNCYQRADIEKFPRVQTKWMSSNPEDKYTVLNLGENKFIINFASTGTYKVRVIKRYDKDQINEYDNMQSTIEFTIEVTDVSNGGFTTRDLEDAGIRINPHPILSCPEVKKNFNGYINCDLTYAYDRQGFRILVEPFELFKICAFRGDPNQFYGCNKGKPYFERDLKLAFNAVQKIKVKVYKDYVSSVHLESLRSGEAVRQVQPNIQKSTQPSTVGKAKSGEWIRKCKNLVALSDTNSRMEITDGRIQGGAVTSTVKVCEDVWVPQTIKP